MTAAMTEPSESRDRRTVLAWTVAIGSGALVLLSAGFSMRYGGSQNLNAALVITVVLATAAFGVVGAVISSRTGNAVGWAMLAAIGLLSVALASQSYATYSLAIADRGLPLDVVAAWVGTVAFFASLALIPSIALLYPTGTPRWRWVWRWYQVAVGVLVVGWALLPQELGLMSNDVHGPDNPFALRSIEAPIGAAIAIAAASILLCSALGVASLVVRYRSSHGDERQQIRWLAYVGLAAGVGLVGNVAVGVALGDQPAPGLPSAIANGVFLAFLWVVVLGIPAACGVAILRYHLYDLDIVIRKARVALVLTLVIVLPTVLAITIAGQIFMWRWAPRPATLLGGVLIGVLLVPLIGWERRIARHLTYGRRASGYEVLTTLAEHVAGSYSVEDVAPRIVRVVSDATGATSARVLLHVSDGVREAAGTGEPTGSEHAFPVIDRGEQLGTLVVTFAPSDPLDPTKERLIRDLVGQAGPVLHNVRLIEELRASRARLVAAQDEERRKLERDIHDGVQQQLVALAVKLRLADTMIDRDPARAHEALTALQADASAALDDLRDLARGIYPPLLADRGLAAALEAQARKAAVPTTVDAVGIGRYPRDVEATVYFCALEALNNIAKYARATSATVTLSRADGHLLFSVADDGDGFDTTVTNHGTGLQGMVDRLAAIDGELHVRSTPGAGTTVTGAVPVEAGP